MIFSKIEMIKIVRRVTSPQLGLVEAKILVEVFSDGFTGYNIEKPSDLDPLFNLCWAYNKKVFVFNEKFEIVWHSSPTLSKEDLFNISRNPNRYDK